jgi:hypothetical protein
MALNQISQLLYLILDRIAGLPTPWLEALAPLVTWLTLHKNDALLSTLFQHYHHLKSDLARVHKILCNYCISEFKPKAGKTLSQAEEEEQLKTV